MRVISEWAVVVKLFPDGSAWVRIGDGDNEGRDVALTAAQAGPAELGEAGRLVNRGRRDMRFVRRGQDVQTL
jgi:hypothetical protein